MRTESDDDEIGQLGRVSRSNNKLSSSSLSAAVMLAGNINKKQCSRNCTRPPSLPLIYSPSIRENNWRIVFSIALTFAASFYSFKFLPLAVHSCLPPSSK